MKFLLTYIVLSVLLAVSDTFWTTFSENIKSIAALVGAIFAGLAMIHSIRGSNRAKKAMDTGERNKEEILITQKAVDGVVTKLLTAKDEVADAKVVAAKQEGINQEKDAQKLRDDEFDKGVELQKLKDMPPTP